MLAVPKINSWQYLIQSLELCEYKPTDYISKISKSVFLITSCQINTNIATIVKVLHLYCLEIKKLHCIISMYNIF